MNSSNLVIPAAVCLAYTLVGIAIAAIHKVNNNTRVIIALAWPIVAVMWLIWGIRVVSYALYTIAIGTWNDTSPESQNNENDANERQ